jgi:hypothetical protein
MTLYATALRDAAWYMAFYLTQIENGDYDLTDRELAESLRGWLQTITSVADRLDGSTGRLATRMFGDDPPFAPDLPGSHWDAP